MELKLQQSIKKPYKTIIKSTIKFFEQTQRIKNNSNCSCLDSYNKQSLSEETKCFYASRYLRKIRFKDSLTLQEVVEKLNIMNINNKDIIQDNTLVPSRYDKKLDYNVRSIIDIESLVNDILKVPIKKRHNFLLFYSKGPNTLSFPISEHERNSGLVNYINSWLTCAVNQMYMEYCCENNIIPKGRISIPEHFIHEIFLASSKLDARKTIEKIIDSYVDSAGRVYHNCYAKCIQKSIKRVNASKDKNNKQPDFLKLLPQYDKTMDVLIRTVHSEKESIKAYINILIASRVINRWIHPKYKNSIKPEIIINTGLCRKYNVKGLYNRLTNNLTVGADCKVNDVVHEITHEIVEKKGLSNTVYNFLFENTKGNPIDKLDMAGINCTKNFKTGLNVLRPYAATIYTDYEMHVPNGELLPEIISYLLDRRKDDVDKVIKLGNSVGEIKDNNNLEEILKQINQEIDNIAVEKLDKMYREFPDLAFFALAFMHGDIR